MEETPVMSVSRDTVQTGAIHQPQPSALPPQSLPCPRCGSRLRELVCNDKGIEARCLDCRAVVNGWQDLLVAWDSVVVAP
jgi:hypothetical protein